MGAKTLWGNQTGTAAMRTVASVYEAPVKPQRANDALCIMALY